MVGTLTSHHPAALYNNMTKLDVDVGRLYTVGQVLRGGSWSE